MWDPTQGEAPVRDYVKRGAKNVETKIDACLLELRSDRALADGTIPTGRHRAHILKPSVRGDVFQDATLSGV